MRKSCVPRSWLSFGLMLVVLLAAACGSGSGPTQPGGGTTEPGGGTTEPGGGPTEPGHGTPEPEPPSSWVRPNLKNLAADGPELKSLRKGIAAMQARSAANASDPLGWTYQANIHATFDSGN